MLEESFEIVNVKKGNFYVVIFCFNYVGEYHSSVANYYNEKISYFGKEINLRVPYIADVDTKITHAAKMMDGSIKTAYNILNYDSVHKLGKTEIKRIAYEEINSIIKLAEECGIAYDKYFSSLVTNYNESVYKKFTTFNSTIDSTLVNYDSSMLVVNPNCAAYYYEYDFGKKYMNLVNLYDDIGENFKMSDEMRRIYQDFTRGINKYLDDKKIFKMKVSNAFVKLWEIYYTHNIIASGKKSKKTELRAFHMCEAPGQWIKTTEEYIENNVEHKLEYKWLANSLNPYNKMNIAKYGKDIISDTYSLMRNNKSKWIYGHDDTGDITKPENILWYRDRLFKTNLHLVSGDAGLPAGDVPLVFLQKLDFAQCVLTLAVASAGTNCVIKCFSPYMKTNPKTFQATGFFVNLMYLYASCFETVYLYKPYASRPQSGEFYIVGKNFTSITEQNLTKLLEVLSKFEENQVFIAREDIPDKFEVLVKDFLQRLITYNIESIEMGYFLNQCYNDPDDIFDFKKLITSKEVEKIQAKRYKTFCEKFNLV